MHDINPNFTIRSEFKGWRENVIRECNVCGDIREVQARTVIEKNHGKLRGCPVCANIAKGLQRRKTNEQFLKELYEVNPNIEPLEEYTTADTYMNFKCKIDGNIFKSRPKDVLQGHGCPECYKRKSNQRTQEQFLEEMALRHPDIEPLDDFINVSTPMRFRCKKCGYIWSTQPTVLLNRDSYSGCPKCAGFTTVSEEEMIARLAECNPTIEYLYGYKGICYHAFFKCKKCGHVWDTPPNSVLHGRGCPHCNLSKGELRIKEVFELLGIDFEFQYRFEECKNERSLPFDFYVSSKNIAIEYDGVQHFIPVRFSKEQTEEDIIEAFEKRKRLDKLKDDYCFNNNIKLIRIPYTEFNNIEEILNKYFA